MSSSQFVTRKGSHHHHQSNTPEYRSWIAMRQRCGVVGGKPGTRYQELGIAVCDQWATSFQQFLADMGPRPEGTTLDRCDNLKGYGPGNCKWSTHKQQSRNTRANVMLTAKGVTKCAAEWAEELGVTMEAIYERLKRGWSEELAATAPKGTRP